MSIRLTLEPSGRVIDVPSKKALPDVLFEYGVEFPCGAKKDCGACKVKVVRGNSSPTGEEELLLPAAEIDDGWRLACCLEPQSDLALAVAFVSPQILSDTTHFQFIPREGFGIAIDVGTTTIVAQLLDLQTGSILTSKSELNAQARHGADIMSRIHVGLDQPELLTSIVRKQLDAMIHDLVSESRIEPAKLHHVLLVGNTVMHHLFSGISVEPLAYYPFASMEEGLTRFRPTELEWNLPHETSVQFLPCLGGFVGSDILSGIIATGIYQSESLSVLIDLGTNGEIVIGNRERMLCCSTAAGPAFEGSRITMGMRAATGAISEVHRSGGGIDCKVIGNVTPRGICGSGLVDAVAVGLDAGNIRVSGRLRNGALRLCQPVEIFQPDIRELQLAKGAIAAGIRILLEEIHASVEDVKTVYLAGAFGNYVNKTSARRIGLLPFSVDQIHPAGNTALLGAKHLLFSDDWRLNSVRSRITHVLLSANPHFQDIFVEEMMFPEH